jgi:hypothetical protein
VFGRLHKLAEHTSPSAQRTQQSKKQHLWSGEENCHTYLTPNVRAIYAFVTLQIAWNATSSMKWAAVSKTVSASDAIEPPL